MTSSFCIFVPLTSPGLATPLKSWISFRFLSEIAWNFACRHRPPTGRKMFKFYWWHSNGIIPRPLNLFCQKFSFSGIVGDAPKSNFSFVLIKSVKICLTSTNPKMFWAVEPSWRKELFESVSTIPMICFDTDKVHANAIFRWTSISLRAGSKRAEMRGCILRAGNSITRALRRLQVSIGGDCNISKMQKKLKVYAEKKQV